MRVVFADDNAMQRVLMRRLLERLPHIEVVGEARDGRESVQLVERTAPDLVLLDVEMPNLDGPSAAELIRSHHPQTHILMHSSGASEHQHTHAAALGLEIHDKSQLLETADLIEGAAAEAPSVDRTAHVARSRPALTSVRRVRTR